MSENDSLKLLLVEFFNLPGTTPVADLTQKSVAQWDSLAMVQLITELQSMYGVQFEVDEIEHLGSYELIRASLRQKGITLE